MAAGLTLPIENIEVLRNSLNEDCTLQDNDFFQKFHIDKILMPDEISLALSDELAHLAPFGKGNHEPLFASRNLFAEKIRVLDEKNTIIFTFTNRLKGIAFGLNEKFHALCENKLGGFAIDAVYNVETNVWNGFAEVQIKLKDFEISLP
jgi:single-stranded-DNA-specific exonuclease